MEVSRRMSNRTDNDQGVKIAEKKGTTNLWYNYSIQKDGYVKLEDVKWLVFLEQSKPE